MDSGGGEETKSVAPTECRPSPSDDGQQPAGEPADGLAGFQLASCIAALLLCMFVVSLDMTILAPAIPKITQEFNSLGDIGWYGSAFFLTISAFSQFWGKAYTYFPLKWVLLVAIALFEVGSLICAVAQNSPTLIIGRAICGTGGAGITNGCYTIIGVVAKPEKRPAYTGLLAAMYGFASVVGPLIGGAFTTDVTWRWCFYLNLPVGGLATFILLVLARLPPSTMVKTTTKEAFLNMDLVGAGLVIVTLVCYLLPLQWGGITKPWRSADIIGLLVGFGLLLVVFVLHQTWLGERAMMVPRLVKHRRTFTLALFNFFMAGSFFTFVYYLPIYFQVIGGYSAIGSSVQNLSLIVGSTIFGIVGGVFMVQVGYFHVFLLGGAFLAALGEGLLCSLTTQLDTGKYVGYQLLVGVGAGVCFQAPVMVGQAFSKPADVAGTTAILLFFQTMGGTVIISAAQSIFSNGLVRSLTAAGFADIDLVVSSADASLRDLLPPDQLAIVMSAYMAGLRQAWALATTCAGLCFVVALCTKVEDIRNAPSHETKQSVVEESSPNGNSVVASLDSQEKGASS